MGRQNAQLYAFNRGLVSRFALARVDSPRTALSAALMNNWEPRILGSMALRPGTQYLGDTKLDAQTRLLPFVFAVDDTALMELTPGFFRVWVGDALVSRVAVATAIANGTFNTDILSWTSHDAAGCTSAWATGGFMSLTGTGTAYAAREQAVTVAAGDVGKVHGIRIVVNSGDCVLRIGSTSGGTEYIKDIAIYSGQHSIAIIPTGTFYVRLMSKESYPCLVDSCTIEAAGTLELATPWTTTANLRDVRIVQSADVVYVACDGVAPYQIQRRDNQSWSVAQYTTYNGPFRVINTSPITMDVGATSGATTLNASAGFFTTGHVGALFTLLTPGRNTTTVVSGLASYSPVVKVTGIGSNRQFTFNISGVYTGTVVVQKSTDNVTFVDLFTPNAGANTFNDQLDNQILYYRIGFSTVYTSGQALVTVSYPGGAIRGVFRCLAYVSPTQMTGNVITNFGDTAATTQWQEGAWSLDKGMPNAVAIHQGRVWWAGKDKMWSTVVDDYANFDQYYVGDAGPISRSIGQGPVDKIRWLASAQNLLMGAQAAEWFCRSTVFDDPLTPTNFNIKAYGTMGSGRVDAIIVDQSIIFVDRSETRIYQMEHDGGQGYKVTHLTAIEPEIGLAGITRSALQRQPDTRAYFVRGDGTVALLTDSVEEDVRCWSTMSTDGLIEDVVVLPNVGAEDSVYFVVNRTIGGVTKRYLEKRAQWSDCKGGTLNKQLDAFVTYTGAAANTFSGLGHLEGKTVSVWGDGLDQGTHLVTGGSITIGALVSNAVIGLPYTADFQSAKLTYAAQGGTPLTQIKRVDHVGLILADTHSQGLQYGADFSNLDSLPLVEGGAPVATGAMYSAYDADSVEFNGTYNTDSRICLRAQAPRPCTVMAAIISISTYDKL